MDKDDYGRSEHCYHLATLLGSCYILSVYLTTFPTDILQRRWYGKGKVKVLGKKSVPLPLFYHKFHMDCSGIELFSRMGGTDD
jgi:hypothetical protein